MTYSPQATDLKICAIDDDLIKKLKKFRFRKEKNNAAIISELIDVYMYRCMYTSYNNLYVLLLCGSHIHVAMY